MKIKVIKDIRLKPHSRIIFDKKGTIINWLGIIRYYPYILKPNGRIYMYKIEINDPRLRVIDYELPQR